MKGTKIFVTVGAVVLFVAACQETAVEPISVETAPSFASESSNICSGAPTAKAPPPGWPILYGTPGDDKMVADVDYAVRMWGRAGDDCLIGGPGRATLFGEEGDDRLIGGPLDDYLHGGPGRDFIQGGDGDDYIVVDDGESDVVRAGRGNDIIYARDGAVDDIDCGEGWDYVEADAFDIVRNCEVVDLPGA